MVRPEGIEPPAYRFEACRSIQLSYGRGCLTSLALDAARRKQWGPAAAAVTRIAVLRSMVVRATPILAIAPAVLTWASSSIGRAADS